MEHFIGLDVSVKVTSICVADDTGVVVLEIKVPSEPVAIAECKDDDLAGHRLLGS